MTSSAGPSPVWLGFIAVVSFGGLVIASFASGYHLVSTAEPGAVTSGPVRAGSRPPRSAVVREGLGKRAVLRSKPNGGEVVEQLTPEQRVSILAESGAWLQVSYERQGKTRQGWVEAVNLAVPDP